MSSGQHGNGCREAKQNNKRKGIQMSLINPTISLQDNLTHLKAQNALFVGAIAQLEGLLNGSAVVSEVSTSVPTPVRRGPGRPKGSTNKKVAAKASTRSSGWSDAARAKARRRMKAYWAARKSGK